MFKSPAYIKKNFVNELQFIRSRPYTPVIIVALRERWREIVSVFRNVTGSIKPFDSLQKIKLIPDHQYRTLEMSWWLRARFHERIMVYMTDVDDGDFIIRAMRIGFRVINMIDTNPTSMGYTAYLSASYFGSITTKSLVTTLFPAREKYWFDIVVNLCLHSHNNSRCGKKMIVMKVCDENYDNILGLCAFTYRKILITGRHDWFRIRRELLRMDIDYMLIFIFGPRFVSVFNEIDDEKVVYIIDPISQDYEMYRDNSDVELRELFALSSDNSMMIWSSRVIKMIHFVQSELYIVLPLSRNGIISVYIVFKQENKLMRKDRMLLRPDNERYSEKDELSVIGRLMDVCVFMSLKEISYHYDDILCVGFTPKSSDYFYSNCIKSDIDFSIFAGYRGYDQLINKDLFDARKNVAIVRRKRQNKDLYYPAKSLITLLDLCSSDINLTFGTVRDHLFMQNPISSIASIDAFTNDMRHIMVIWRNHRIDFENMSPKTGISGYAKVLATTMTSACIPSNVRYDIRREILPCEVKKHSDRNIIGIRVTVRRTKSTKHKIVIRKAVAVSGHVQSINFWLGVEPLDITRFMKHMSSDAYDRKRETRVSFIQKSLANKTYYEYHSDVDIELMPHTKEELLLGNDASSATAMYFGLTGIDFRGIKRVMVKILDFDCECKTIAQAYLEDKAL